MIRFSQVTQERIQSAMLLSSLKSSFCSAKGVALTRYLKQAILLPAAKSIVSHNSAKEKPNVVNVCAGGSPVCDHSPGASDARGEDE